MRGYLATGQLRAVINPLLRALVKDRDVWGFENQWDFNVFMTDMEILHIPTFRGSEIMHRFFDFLAGCG